MTRAFLDHVAFFICDLPKKCWILRASWPHYSTWLDAQTLFQCVFRNDKCAHTIRGLSTPSPPPTLLTSRPPPSVDLKGPTLC